MKKQLLASGNDAGLALGDGSKSGASSAFGVGFTFGASGASGAIISRDEGCRMHGYTFGDAAIIEALLSDKVVTVPTETVEGYAVRLSSKRAVGELMRKKERGINSGKVFTLVPESAKAISKYAIVPTMAQQLIDSYMPGELTVILPKNPDFRHFYYDNFETIGIRIPDHPLFELIGEKAGAVMLTSANPRGGIPRSITGHLPSTIVDFSDVMPKIMRQGELKIDLAKFLKT